MLTLPFFIFSACNFTRDNVCFSFLLPNSLLAAFCVDAHRTRNLLSAGISKPCRMAMVSHLIQPGGFSALFVVLISEALSGNSVVVALKNKRKAGMKPSHSFTDGTYSSRKPGLPLAFRHSLTSCTIPSGLSSRSSRG